MVTPPRHVLVRYHEIALKGRNQPMFVKHLTENLRRATVGTGVERVWSERMGLHMQLADDASWPAVRDRVRKVFGGVKFALARKVPAEYDAIAEAVAAAADETSFATFRITSNRAHKRFPLTSRDLNVRLGDLVRERTGARVDLHNAEVEFHIDVAANDAYVYLDGESGAGGLPVNTAGKVTVLMSGGIDSPVAAWRMLRRGCRAILVHFHSFPLVEARSREKARDLAEIINGYQFDTRLYLVPFADVQRRLILTVPPRLRVVAYRRFMVRIAEAIAKNEGARALVTGESLGQVSSQTLQNMATVGEVASLPILRPLVGMDKQEIIEQAQAIGSFDTSILPDEDCCTLFVPRSPSTAVHSYEITPYEDELDIPALVRQAVEESDVVDYHAPVAEDA